MSVAAAHADAFYGEVAEHRVVWSIRDHGGIPCPASAVEGNRAMPFWSSESRARRVIENVPAYSAFSPFSILWKEFCERWIFGLAKDGLLIGVNWSGSLATGYDIAPGEVQRNVEYRMVNKRELSK